MSTGAAYQGPVLELYAAVSGSWQRTGVVGDATGPHRTDVPSTDGAHDHEPT